MYVRHVRKELILCVVIIHCYLTIRTGGEGRGFTVLEDSRLVRVGLYRGDCDRSSDLTPDVDTSDT